MEAARTAVVRGHNVTLFEKTGELGGSILGCCLVPGKDKMKWFADWLRRQISKMDNIKVKLNYMPTLEELKKFDVVLNTTGASSYVPEIFGDIDSVIPFEKVMACPKVKCEYNPGNRKPAKVGEIQNSLISSKQMKTGITIAIPIGNNRIFFTFTGGNEYLNFYDLDLGKIVKSTHLHISSFYLLKNLQDDVLRILKYLKSLNITTSFDTGYDPKENWQRQKIFKILEYIDIFMLNEIEALNITNKKNIVETINLLSKYCPIVIIKLGPKGLVAKDSRGVKSKTIFLLPYDVDVVDTSCCGDCFDAGFIYGYLKDYDFEKNLDFANACGSLQASKLGSYKFKGVFEIENLMKVTKKVNLN